MIGCGVVGAFISGLYVDMSKKFALVAKTCFALSAVSATFLAVVCSSSKKKETKWNSPTLFKSSRDICSLKFMKIKAIINGKVSFFNLNINKIV